MFIINFLNKVGLYKTRFNWFEQKSSIHILFFYCIFLEYVLNLFFYEFTKVKKWLTYDKDKTGIFLKINKIFEVFELLKKGSYSVFVKIFSKLIEKIILTFFYIVRLFIFNSIIMNIFLIHDEELDLDLLSQNAEDSELSLEILDREESNLLDPAINTFEKVISKISPKFVDFFSKSLEMNTMFNISVILAYLIIYRGFFYIPDIIKFNFINASISSIVLYLICKGILSFLGMDTSISSTIEKMEGIEVSMRGYIFAIIYLITLLLLFVTYILELLDIKFTFLESNNESALYWIKHSKIAKQKRKNIFEKQLKEKQS